MELKKVEQQYMVEKYLFKTLVELEARDEGFHQEKKWANCLGECMNQERVFGNYQSECDLKAVLY